MLCLAHTMVEDEPQLTFARVGNLFGDGNYDTAPHKPCAALRRADGPPRERKRKLIEATNHRIDVLEEHNSGNSTKDIQYLQSFRTHATTIQPAARRASFLRVRDSIQRNNKQTSQSIFFPLFRPTTSPHRRLARLAAKVRQQAREVSGDVEGDG